MQLNFRVQRFVSATAFALAYCFLSIWSSAARAETLRSNDFSLNIGSALYSELTIGSAIPTKVGPLYILRFLRRWAFKNDQYWIAETTWLYSGLQYEAGAETKAGSLYQLGFGGGYEMNLAKGIYLKTILTLSPLAGLNSGATGSININNKVVKYATLSTFSGGVGFQPRATISKSFMLFNWKFPLAASLSILYLQHNFANRKDQSLVSDSALTVVPEPTQDKAKIKMSVLELGLTISL